MHIKKWHCSTRGLRTFNASFYRVLLLQISAYIPMLHFYTALLYRKRSKYLVDAVIAVDCVIASSVTVSTMVELPMMLIIKIPLALFLLVLKQFG